MGQRTGGIIIGVSGRHRTKSVRAMLRQISDEGATPLLLNNQNEDPQAPRQDLARIDALVLMGNPFDIDPHCYIRRYQEGDPRRRIHPRTKSESDCSKASRRALYETAILKLAIQCGMPILGICGGMQRINVLCGGTLHQHIPDLIVSYPHMQHKKGIAPTIPVVPVVIKEDTMLADIACDLHMPFIKDAPPDCPKVIMENSMHHQSIDRIAPGFRVCAVTDSVRLKSGRAGYLAEAIETDPEGPYAGQFILGVQWHPEFGASSLGERIVRRLSAAALEYRAVKAARAPRPRR